MSAQKILLIAVILLVETSVASFASFFLKKASSGDSKIDIIKSPFFYLGGIRWDPSHMCGRCSFRDGCCMRTSQDESFWGWQCLSAE